MFLVGIRFFYYPRGCKRNAFLERNACIEDRKAPKIRINHDVLVTTSDFLASSRHELKARVFDVDRSV